MDFHMIQGNKGSFNDDRVIGYCPEIVDAVFRLYAMVASDTHVLRICVHEEEIPFSTEHGSLLEGHARDILFAIMEANNRVVGTSKGTFLNAHEITREIQRIAQRLGAIDLTDIERAILTAEEGSTVLIRKHSVDSFAVMIQTFNIKLMRHTAYAKWQEMTKLSNVFPELNISKGPVVQCLVEANGNEIKKKLAFYKHLEDLAELEEEDEY
ncbi:MAG: hypothetical protein H9W81_18445 [Enterococcus sp.]|nr:hypothetical protein [Enterococcus sp.]